MREPAQRGAGRPKSGRSPKTRHHRGAVITRTLAAAIALCLAAGPAFAEVCGPSIPFAKRLMEHYHELPTGMALGTDGNVWQLWQSAERGTWTIVKTTPKGRSCVEAAGKHGWQQLKPAVEPGEPA